ncbi:MAG TPA: hypothetical protein VLZ32_03840 [Rhodanobacter sp.]|nr:hypothetical protein [Rhodanobacter sp.]
MAGLLLAAAMGGIDEWMAWRRRGHLTIECSPIAKWRQAATRIDFGRIATKGE